MTDTTTEDPIEQAKSKGRSRLLESEAKQLLSSAGINVPTHELASSLEAAVDAAERIGYPVVLKVSASAVQHKSEWADGAGVALDLKNGQDFREAAERIFEAADDTEISADVLVEEAADTDRGLETIVGGVRDESFGPVLLFGLGGTFTEVLQDTSYRLAPISTAEAHDMLADIDATPLLDGYRGRPAVDRRSLAETITTVGGLLVERESIQEMEINPLLATADSEPVALDALVTLR